MEVLICPWETSYRFVADTVPTLLYYSHIPAAVAAIVFGVFVYLKSKDRVPAKLLLLLFVLFSIWTLVDLLLWTYNSADVTVLGWSVQLLVEILIYYSAFHLIYYFILRKHLGLGLHVLIIYFVAPLLAILFPTRYNLSGTTTSCSQHEIPFTVYYLYGLELFFIFAILIIMLVHTKGISEYADRIRAFYLTVGTIVFLVAFTSGNIIGSLTGDWNLAQYGLFGMPVFIALLVYLIVRFDLFRFKVIGAHALVFIVWFAVASLLFMTQSDISRTTSITVLFLQTIFGIILIKSVKKESEQRKKIEKLAGQLKKSNARLKILDRMKSEFVAIASHQLRSPLNSIRGYASMLLEGTYGKLTKKVTGVVQRIADSSRFMALSINDYLNVSLIEAGNLKYEKAEFKLNEAAKKVVDEMRPAVLKKGLLMLFKSDCTGTCRVRADVGKIRQAIMNLIDNSMRYTPEGNITVCVHDDVKKKKIYVTVEDTGVGMNKETIEEIFDKFIRAKNANEINVTGTGLGLYVAKKMITEMGGRIWAESEGEGKGSRFHIEFPLVSNRRKK